MIFSKLYVILSHAWFLNHRLSSNGPVENKQSEPAACRQQQAAELVGAEGGDRDEEEDDTAATAKQMTAIKLMSWQIWNHLGADERYQDDDDDDDSDDRNAGVYFSRAPAPLSLSLSLRVRCVWN